MTLTSVVDEVIRYTMKIKMISKFSYFNHFNDSKIFSLQLLGNIMTEFSSEEKIILIQYGIKKYEDEATLFEKLKAYFLKKTFREI